MADENHHLTIDAKLDCLSTIRRFVRGYAEGWGMHPEATADLVLAVDEAATNIIVHGYRGQDGIINVEIEQDGDALVVYLRDSAPPFDPTTLPPPDLSLPLEKRPLGGMGVFLLNGLMDDVRHKVTSEGGNELTLIKKRQG